MKTFTTLRAFLAGAAILIAPAACSNDNTSEPIPEQKLPSLIDDGDRNFTNVVPNDNVVHIDGNPAADTVHAAVVAAVRNLRGDKR